MSKIITRALSAELDSLNAMSSSVKSVIEDMREKELKLSVLVLSCPKFGEWLARVAAGQVAPDNVESTIISAIASDLGHDVEFGILNDQAKQKIQRREVSQPVSFASENALEMAIEGAKVALEYLDAKQNTLR